MAPSPQREVYFIVTSGGRAATYWLSHLLNESDDIFCMHGYYPVDELPAGEKNAPDDFGQTGYKIGDIHNLDGSARTPEEWEGIGVEQRNRFDSLTIDEYFATLRRRHDVRVYGNVHGYTYDSLLRKARANRPTVNLRIANLTRHPVSRVQSFYRRFLHTEKWVPEAAETVAERKARGRKLRDSALHRFGIDLYDDAYWLFPDSIIRMVVQYAEATVANIPQVMSEALTSDKEQFKDLFAALTDGRVELSARMLDDATFARRLNRTQDRSDTPEEIFAAWEPWQRYVFRGLIMPEWLEGYARVGYDVSFIPGAD